MQQQLALDTRIRLSACGPIHPWPHCTCVEYHFFSCSDAGPLADARTCAHMRTSPPSPCPRATGGVWPCRALAPQEDLSIEAAVVAQHGRVRSAARPHARCMRDAAAHSKSRMLPIFATLRPHPLRRHALRCTPSEPALPAHAAIVPGRVQPLATHSVTEWLYGAARRRTPWALHAPARASALPRHATMHKCMQGGGRGCMRHALWQMHVMSSYHSAQAPPCIHAWTCRAEKEERSHTVHSARACVCTQTHSVREHGHGHKLDRMAMRRACHCRMVPLTLQPTDTAPCMHA